MRIVRPSGPRLSPAATEVEPRKYSFLRTNTSMAKRRDQQNWGSPEPIGPVVPTVTSFEQITKEFKLPPDQYIRSTRLREWSRRNKTSLYIPEACPKAWG